MENQTSQKERSVKKNILQCYKMKHRKKELKKKMNRAAVSNGTTIRVSAIGVLEEERKGEQKNYLKKNS